MGGQFGFVINPKQMAQVFYGFPEIYFEHFVVDIGWFQKISIPIPQAASRNSEGEGGLRRLEFRGQGGQGGVIGLEFRRHAGIFRRVTSSLV